MARIHHTHEFRTLGLGLGIEKLSMYGSDPYKKNDANRQAHIRETCKVRP